MNTSEQAMLGARPVRVIDKLPSPEEVFNLPKLTWGNIFTKVLGPAAIPLGMAIGSGEWLMGPAVAAGYGLGLFWLVWIGMVIQAVYNVWWARMVVAVGEPINVLLSRIPPAHLWSTLSMIFSFLRMFWPGWAAAAATGLMAIVLGKIPGAAEAELVRWTGVVLFLLCAFLVSIGGKIESTLEIIEKLMIAFILGALIFILVPVAVGYRPAVIGEAVFGSLNIGRIPRGVDLLLFAGWFAYIGDACAANADGSGYWRDKGYGTGSKVGFIPAVIGGKKIMLSPLGAVFKITPENLKTWKVWERMINLDMWLIFFIGGMLGMYLPSIMVAALVPPGTTLPAWGIAAHVANEMKAIVGPWGYYLVAFTGFMVLFSTQLGVVDRLTRIITDVSWTSVEAIRKWTKGDVRRLYYPALLIYLAFGCSSLWIAAPLIILLIGANIVHFYGVWLIPALTYIDRKILPKELRAPIWMPLVAWILWAFHLFFAIALTLFYGFGIKIF
ncbi:MAG: Nramp family divalent metal transporter [Sulfolobales archaeon]|nr:Nramp family divalent metal transporter [Sulfolobales archaeon]MCX8186612.1 Nramp family divalent metal transporter [Sulfolobales archaeon]